ncbi:hypothetical protein [Nonomuraea rhodomycinica]|uniref:Uncharacterized protein n=1 Tax=Nonomuraea rhodomycinica TaxID=1712872 RepID=A0A7Y6M9I1_9ACTN|nr:hypothetical protein [Nonomuraea rhodomycinica]NUW38611.1 hypothetical protein [Nonomuraea rhodomycinica]
MPWTVVFVGVLVTYVTFVVMLLPQGYSLWVVLGAATTTCVVAGQVTRAVRLALAGERVAGAGAHRSLLGRAVAAWIREAVAEEPTEPGGRTDGRESGGPERGGRTDGRQSGDGGDGGRAGKPVREPDPVD